MTVLMKTLALITLLAVGGGSAQAQPRHGNHHRSSWHSSVSFSVGAYPYAYPYYYSPGVAYSYPYYSGYGYGYSRPNYAVNGVLSGALIGGIIGDSIHHQGWEGAGIGAAAGLLLGGIAESTARRQDRKHGAQAGTGPLPDSISICAANADLSVSSRAAVPAGA
jgi:hypothetical protein